MTDDAMREALQAALEPLPTERGGVAIVLATAGPPPAMGLLSSGDVVVEGDRVRVATYRGSTAAERLGGAFTLLVPAGEVVYRLEVTGATARRAGRLELIEGRLAALSPTSEPPWLLEMSFRPMSGEDDSVPRFVDHWAAVRAWLEGGAEGDFPPPA